MLQVKNLFLVFRLFKKIKSYTVCIKSSISHDLVPKKWEAAWRSCSLLVGPFCVHQQPEFYLSDPLTCCRFISTSHQSSTVLRCLWGETAASMLWGKHSDFSAVLPQQDQWGFPGCPLWPWPQPLNPPAEGFESSKTCLNENHASNCFFFLYVPGMVPGQPQRASLAPPLEQKEQQWKVPLCCLNFLCTFRINGEPCRKALWAVHSEISPNLTRFVVAGFP